MGSVGVDRQIHRFEIKAHLPDGIVRARPRDLVQLHRAFRTLFGYTTEPTGRRRRPHLSIEQSRFARIRKHTGTVAAVVPGIWRIAILSWSSGAGQVLEDSDSHLPGHSKKRLGLRTSRTRMIPMGNS